MREHIETLAVALAAAWKRNARQTRRGPRRARGTFVPVAHTNRALAAH